MTTYRLNNILRKLLLVIGLLFAVVILMIGALFLVPDSSLSELSKSMLEQASTAGSSQGHAYLMGLDAPEGVSPEELGASRMAAYASNKAEGASNPPIENALRPMDAKTRGDCKPNNAECLKPLLDNPKKLDELIAKTEIPFLRYQTYLAFGEDVDMQPVSPEQTPPPLQMVMEGNWGLRYRALAQAKAGNGAEAAKLLLNDIDSIRTLLPKQNQLIGKLFEIRIIEADIALLSALQGWGYIDRTSAIQMLTPTEQSFDLPIYREFANSERLVKGLTKQSHMVSFDFELPLFVNKALLKENRTINKMAEIFKSITDQSNSTPQTGLSKAPQSYQPSFSDMVLNPFGSILASVAQPDYSGYMLSGVNLSEQIYVFNQLQSGDTEIKKRYKDTPGPITVVDGKVCFQSVQQAAKGESETCLYQLAN
jgi:hypothetical protein